MLSGSTRMDNDPYPYRKMRPFWRWHIRIFATTGVATLGLLVWRDSSCYAAIPFAVGGLLMFHMHYLVRCPRCSRRIRARVAKERGRGDSWRYLYDCPECQVTWDSQYVQDAGSS